ncbi:MAG: glycosyltransferase family 39 protein [Planctomycetes bacterium]|nr:glycosyltransferase family 39 protein [Planctomycetota bacterium]
MLAATVPFLCKAFHIDDPLYLAVARQILAKPWDPFGGEMLWEHEPESLFDADFNPPLWSYCLAGVLAVTGEPTVTLQEVESPIPGTPYFRAQTSRKPEVALHLLESVFVAAAIVAMYRLAQRWVRWPLTATALVALSPAMLPGQNVMLEGPVMAFWLWGVWCHLRAIETDCARWTWASGVLAALAVLTKYTSGLVLILLALYSIRRRHWRSLWFLAPPLAALALWTVHNLIVYERVHLLVILSRAQTGERHPVGIRVGESWGRMLAILRVLGAVTALALPIARTAARRWGARVALGLALAASAVGWVGKWDMDTRLGALGITLEDVPRADALTQWLEEHPHPPTNLAGLLLWGTHTLSELAVIHGNCIHAIAFGALGAYVLGGLALVSWPTQQRAMNGATGNTEPNREVPGKASGSPASEEEFLLWLWLGLVLAFNIFAVPFLAARHLLPGLPPLVWLVLRRLDQQSGPTATPGSGRLLGWTTFLTAACGFLAAKADYDFAEWYRHMAVDVASRSAAGGRLKEKQLWFTGHWGWPYYAERVGLKPFLPSRFEVHAGDFLLMPVLQTWTAIPDELHPNLQGRMETIKPKPWPLVQTPFPWINNLLDGCLNSGRTISTGVHFYGHAVNDLPWRFSRNPLDDFAVIEVMADIKGEGRPRSD